MPRTWTSATSSASTPTGCSRPSAGKRDFRRRHPATAAGKPTAWTGTSAATTFPPAPSSSRPPAIPASGKGWTTSWRSWPNARPPPATDTWAGFRAAGGLGEELAAGTVDADLFTLNGRWVPLYNLHKTFAGLLDAYTYAGSAQALAMLTALADWWLGISATPERQRLRGNAPLRVRRPERHLRRAGGHHRPRRLPPRGAPVCPPRHPGPAGRRTG